VFQKLSYTENVDLKWVSLLLQSLVFIWGIIAAIVIINKIAHFIDIEAERAIIYCVICVYVFFIGYNGIRQSAIVSVFKENEAIPTKFSQEEPVKDNEQFYFDKIKQLVEEEKLYLNPKLSIKDIAERLKTNVNYVSRAINNKAENNFFEFINKYRVREYERVVILPEKANYTLLAIALECGFNSKASFNRIVKDTTGLTPIELKNKLLHDLRP
jgi:AraC-like DNA-binding protein